jgi:peroxiredoxin
MKSLLSFVTLFLATLPTTAGEFNKVLSIGDKAPDFTNLEGTDSKKHSLSDFQGKSCVVVFFTCNSCPVANDYEDRISKISKKYCEGQEAKVAIVAINVNTIVDDKLDKMIDRAKKKKYSYPYLYDPSQKIAKDYGAIYTPEFFVLNADRKIAYMGALDDKNKPDDAKIPYLSTAIDAVLAGQAIATTETLARGCKIRFNSR